MDRQNRGRMLGALRSTRLLENRHCHGAGRSRPEEGIDFYRPAWMNGPGFALLTAREAVDAGEGEVLPFDECSGCGEGDRALLTVPGIYYAAYAVHMPQGQQVHADLMLQLEDRLLRDSHLRLDHDGAQRVHAMAHGIFEVDRAARLCLRTRQPIHLRSERHEPVITLAVFRIG